MLTRDGLSLASRMLTTALVLVISGAAHAQTSASWQDAIDGDWIDPTMWSTDLYPDNGQPAGATYDVVVDASGSPYQINLETDISLNSLTLNAADAMLYHHRGVLEVPDLEVGSGTYQLLGNAVLRNTRIRSGEALIIGPHMYGGVPEFDGITLAGGTDLNLDRAILQIRNGLALEESTISLTGWTSGLRFVGDQHLSGVGTIQFNARNANELSANHSTLTIGEQIRLEVGESTDFGSTGAVIHNHGQISVLDGRAFLRVRGDRFENHGEIHVAPNRTILIQAESWINAGQIVLEQGSTLQLGGTFTINDLGSIENHGAQYIDIYGTLDNRDRTLDVGAMPAPLRLVHGTILGGRITSSTDANLQFAAGYGTLDGVTIASDMTVDSRYQHTARNGLTLDGSTLTMTSGFGFNFAGGDQTLGGQGEIIVNYRPDSSGVTSAFDSSSTLTIGSGITIRTGEMAGGGSLAIAIGRRFGSFVNQGRLVVDKGHMIFRGENWTNEGIVEVHGGQLSLDGSFTTDNIGMITQTDGRVRLVGQLDNTGQTFFLNETTPDWQLAGFITGGTLSAAEGYAFFQPAEATLNGVTLAGGYRVNPNARTRVENSLSFQDGTLSLGSGAELWILPGSQTLGGQGEIHFDGPDDNVARIRMFTGTDLTIESGITLRTVNGSGFVGTGSLPVTIHGDAYAETPDDILFLGGTLTITGKVAARNGGTLALTSVWNNQGVIHLRDGRVALGGGFTPEAVGTFDREGGTVQVIGTLDLTSYDGVYTPDAVDGSIQLAGGTIRGGVIDDTEGGRWEAVEVDQRLTSSRNSVLDGVEVRSALTLQDGSQVRVENGTTFTGPTVTLASEGKSTRLFFNGDYTLNSPAKVVFAGGSDQNYLDTFRGTLTIAPDVTVQAHDGSGHIGQDNPTQILVNQGVVSVRGAGSVMNINGTSVTNEGTLVAAEGGRMIVRGLDGALGAIDLASGGTLEVDGSGYTLDIGVTVEQAGLILRGSWSQMAPLEVVGDGMLGLEQMPQAGSSHLPVLRNARLRLIAGFTPDELGVLDVQQTRLEVDEQGALDLQSETIDLGSGTFDHLHVMGEGVVHGGTIAASGVTVDPPRLTASDNAQFRDIDLRTPLEISGGTIRLENVSVSDVAITRSMTLMPASSTSHSAFDGLLINNTMDDKFRTVTLAVPTRLTAGSTLAVVEGMTLHSTLDIEADNTFVSPEAPDLLLQGTQTVDGTGRIGLMAGAGVPVRVEFTGDLTLGQNLVVELVDGVTEMYGSGGTLVNRGTIQTRADASKLRLLDSDIINEGVIETQGATIHISNGTLLNSQGGLIRGWGVLAAGSSEEFVNEGTIAPGSENDPIGTLSVAFTSFTQLQDGTIQLELLSGETVSTSDRLVLSLNAMLGGSLEVMLASDSSAPQPGEVFRLLDFNPVMTEGQFDRVVLPDLASDHRWDTSALYTQGEIRVVPEPVSGLLLGLGGVLLLRRRRPQPC